MRTKLEQFLEKLSKRGYSNQASLLREALDQSFIEGPSVQIDPGLQSDIQEAVAEVRRIDPGFFKGVSKVVGYSGGEYGKVVSEDPTIIYINLQKIKQKVQQDLGSEYKPSNPEHQKTFKEALKRSLVETLVHEKAHVKDWDPEAHKFKGGEGVAESAEKAIIQKMHYDKPIEASHSGLARFALLVQKVNPKTDRKEWALVSREDRKPLKYFGPTKPSKEAIEKEEKRIQYFKHQGSLSIDTTKRVQFPLSTKAQVGQEQSSHLDGVDLYNITGNDAPAGGANFKSESTRQQTLIKLREKHKNRKKQIETP